jgi:hypothetical protein
MHHSTAFQYRPYKPEGKRIYLRDQAVDGRIILKWIFLGGEGLDDFIQLAQDRIPFWVLVNTVMILQVT